MAAKRGLVGVLETMEISSSQNVSRLEERVKSSDFVGVDQLDREYLPEISCEVRKVLRELTQEKTREQQ